MAHSVLRVSIAAFGAAAFLSSFPLSIARADTTPTPSFNEPASTPDFWVESGPDEATVGQHAAPRRHVRHYARRYAWRNGRRHAYSYNPVAAAATGLARVVADLGSLAAYPLYCFPNYGSCSVRRPHRF